MKVGYLILEKDLRIRKKKFFLLTIIAAISSYICLIPIIIVDFFLCQFQLFYFGIQKIPKIRRSKFIRVDRHKLKDLNLPQKINCVYCGYANGVVAYAKAVVNQMERYSCAIKHKTTPLGHEHHSNFHERKEFME